MKIATSLLFLALPLSAFAALDSSKVIQAEAKKTNTYFRDGIIVGGSAQVKDVLIEDIRRAKNAGFERVVVDLKSALSESTETPFYQVSVEPDRKRIVVSVFGKARTGFNAQKIQKLFAKSSVISKLELLPQVDPGVWMFAMHLKDAPSVEVFELSSPARLILDLRLPSGAQASRPARLRAQAPKPKKAAPIHEELPTQVKDEESDPSALEGVPELTQ